MVIMVAHSKSQPRGQTLPLAAATDSLSFVIDLRYSSSGTEHIFSRSSSRLIVGKEVQGIDIGGTRATLLQGSFIYFLWGVVGVVCQAMYNSREGTWSVLLQQLCSMR